METKQGSIGMNLTMEPRTNSIATPSAGAVPEETRVRAAPRRQSSASELFTRQASKLTIEDIKSDRPRLEWDDLVLGQLLGKGAFNHVYEATLKESSPRVVSTHLDTARTYAVKHVTQDGKSSNAKMAVQDLLKEAQLLSTCCQHDSIISLRAISSSFAVGSCFLVLDRLRATLETKLTEWQAREGKARVGRFLAGRDSKRRIRGREERLEGIGIPIADAFDYLQSQSILFRDLKPANIGYDQFGTIKLFDFGLAKKVTNDGKQMTGFIGSVRYMAPEVAEHMDYGLPADVYSFAIMLWEILMLRKPFEHSSASDIAENVVRGRQRPRVNRNCGSIQLQRILQLAWHKDPKLRPSFAKIRSVMQQEIQRHGGSGGNRRFSFDKNVNLISGLGRQQQRSHSMSSTF